MAPTRTRFVWLASQPHDHAAQFMQIHGAAQRRESEGQNRWVLARGRFTINDTDAPAAFDLTSDGRFRCWVNGGYLGGGPVRSTPAFLRCSRFDLRGRLHGGENLLAVLIHLPGRDLAWYETAKGGWQPVFGDGGLFAQLDCAGASPAIAWRMIESDAWLRDAPLSGWGQNALELFDANRLDPAWQQPGFDDTGWEHARPMRAEPGEEVRARGWGAVEPFRYPVASATPPLAEYEVGPARLHWIRSVEPRPDLGPRERLYSEPLGAHLPSPQAIEELHLVTPAGADLAAMVSFDPYRVGRPFVEFTARGGETIEIAVEEALPGEFGCGESGDGLRAKERLWVAHLGRTMARPGRQRFEWFHPTGVRAMQLVLRNAPKGITIHRLGLIACHHATELEGEFACGDRLLDTLWQRGRHTVLMCAQDGWIDCPGRESRQWLGDGVVMFDMAAYSIGSGIFSLHRQFLDQVAEGQRADGLARMVSPGDIPASITIPDYTLHWLIGVERYLDHSGDLDSVRRWFPSLERALGWLDRATDSSGLIADVPEWHFIEWADLGRSGWSLPFNALAAGALSAMGRMAQRLGRGDLAAHCKARVAAIGEAINHLHWDEGRGVYVDSVDPLSLEPGLRASQHGNALALLFDLAPSDRAARALAAITDRSLLRLTDAPPIAMNDGPFDEARNVVRANSFFAHFVYDAIARAGRRDWVIDEVRALYGPMLEAGATTLWESFAPVASLCHGFSATPVYLMSRHLLGISPIEPGFTEFRVTDPGPETPSASGVVPTPFGPIRIAWSRNGQGREALVEHPAQCRPVADGSNGAVSARIGSDCSRFAFGRP